MRRLTIQSLRQLLRVLWPVQMHFMDLIPIALVHRQMYMVLQGQVMAHTQVKVQLGSLKAGSRPRLTWTIMLHPLVQRIMHLNPLLGRPEKPEVMGKAILKDVHRTGMNLTDHTSFYNARRRNILPNRRETCHIYQQIWWYRSRIVSSLESMIGCHSAPLTLLPNTNFLFL